jgi:hypothetical protein
MASNNDKIGLYTLYSGVPAHLHQYTIQTKLTKSKKSQQMVLFTSFINITVQLTIIKSKTFRDIFRGILLKYII